MFRKIILFYLDSVPSNFNSFVIKQKEIFSNYLKDSYSLKNYNSFSKKSYKNKHYMHFVVDFDISKMNDLLIDKLKIYDLDFLNNIYKLINSGMFCSEILNRVEAMYSVYVNYVINIEMDIKKLDNVERVKMHK